MITHTQDSALARSEVYGLLARGLSHPDAALLAALSDGSYLADLTSALSACSTPGVSETPGVEQAGADALATLRSVAASEAPDLARQYLILFGPSYFAGQSPYETAYLEQQLFQKMQQMADIAGFYRAFGVEASSIERPDYLATELEFMHFLTYRESRARELAHDEGADVCLQAQRGFLRDHIARWAPAFCARLAEETDAPVYAALGALAAAFVPYDAACLGVELRPLGVAVAEPMQGEDEACGACPVPSTGSNGDGACPADTPGRETDYALV